MRIDHGGAYVLMPEKFLDSANVVRIFKQVRGKRMTQGMRRCVLVDSRIAQRLTHAALNRFFICVMARHAR